MDQNKILVTSPSAKTLWQLLPEDGRILHMLIDIARRSTCHRSRCGALVTNGTLYLGAGWNSKPRDCYSSECIKDSLPEGFKSDPTCCVHAEQRAIMDTLEREGTNRGIFGSSLYFLRLDTEGKPEVAGDPYCTTCSKMALDIGIVFFCLWNGDGWRQYDTKIYNELSFSYGKK